MEIDEKQMKTLARQHELNGYGHSSGIIMKNVKKSRNGLKKNYSRIKNTSEKLIALVPSTRWILDNFYLVEREMRIVGEISRKELKRVPVLRNGRNKGYPRIYDIVFSILESTAYHLDEDTLISFLNEYQKESVLSISELWLLNNAVKICIIEKTNKIIAEISSSINTKKRANKMIDSVLYNAGNSSEEIIYKVKRRIRKNDKKNTGYISQIIYRLNELDIEDSMLRAAFPIDTNNEVRYQADLQVKISSVITSLIEISTLDFERLFKKVSMVEKILNEDPSGIYPMMSFKSKDNYHRIIFNLARSFDIPEVEIARKSISLSNASYMEPNSQISHVGYYIAGKGKNELEMSFFHESGFLKRIFSLIKNPKGLFYFLGIFNLTVFISALTVFHLFNVNNDIPVYILIPVISSVIILSLTAALEIVNYIVTRFIKPHLLLSLDFKNGIPDEYRTIAIIPVLLGSTEQAKNYIENMETYYSVNRDKNIYFALVGDFKDAPEEQMPEDKIIVNYTAKLIKELNIKYTGEEEGPFFYFHRSRKWNENEGCWMGWERKRGKIEEFNRLLLGGKDTSYTVIKGKQSLLATFRYVITIDADTELTLGSAVKLIGVMAHPLNRPVLNDEGTAVVEGYGILQPRIGVRINYASATHFSGIFSGEAGINPYIYAISDVYQDIFGQGSFAGKGIYDIRIFDRVLKNSIPENSVLSHDLLEGCYVRCGFLNDIQLMDGYPSSIISYFKREHRWIRGDWQLLPFLFGKNSLNRLCGWKITDNLRRSVVPLSQLILIILSFTVIHFNPVIVAAFVFFTMLFSLSVNIADTVLQLVKKLNKNIYVSDYFKPLINILIQGIIQFALMPYRSYISVDAILRTLYRLYFSHRKMLEWQTAESLEKYNKTRLLSYISQMWIGPAAGIILFIPAMKYNLPVLSVTGTVWMVSPFISYLLSLPSKKEKPVPFGRGEIQDLRRIARKTWRYFEEFFTEKDNWLTPDNYQIDPGNILTRKTSPTNIGLQIMSTLSAADLGYLSRLEFLNRIEKIFTTILKIERWNGHFYNWYDTRTLEILYPHYVSTVDSGNLCAYIIVLKNALEEIINKPLLSNEHIEGLTDTLKLAGMDFIKELPNSVKEWKKVLENLQNQLSGVPKQWENEEWRQISLKLCMALMEDIEYMGISDMEQSIPCIRCLAENGNEGAINLMNRIASICENSRKLLLEADFKYLYDERRSLFRVGYNVSLNSPDSSYYDLLASEARLTSFIAIAKGDVPEKHWYKLGRPLTVMHGDAALVSWSGTMFEYLLPNLVMKVFPGTIFEQTYKAAVRKQIEYGKYRKVPWGISESGYYHFDRELNYQYRAFGVPGLGFKSDLRKSLVIAPYATLLAISISPTEAYKNLNTLKNFKAEGKYGFYEAIDFAESSSKGKNGYRIIKSFMIHHQGMSFVALLNLIKGDIMQYRFHREAMVRGAEVLLEEVKPHGMITREREDRTKDEQAARFSRRKKDLRTICTVRPKYPIAQVYSNKNYTIMLTSNGNGFSKYNDMFVSRWRPDINEQGTGMYFYIRDIKTKKYWSAAYLPTGVEPEYYRVAFNPDKAEYIRRDGHIETKTEVTVSPKDNIEVRRITLLNKGMETVNLEITSYFEPVLDSYENDLAHPAFSKLFISTEYMEDLQMLIAVRRPRKEGEEKRYAFCSVAIKGRTASEAEYETDRYKFLGRGNSLRSPQVMESSLPMSNTAGNVLDPVMSQRISFTILPGRSATAVYITGVAASRENAIEIISKYRNYHTCDDVFKMALFDSEAQMQYLGITPRQVNAIQDITAGIYYPLRLLRGPADAIAGNRLGQSALWKFGISGDYPVLLFRIENESQLESLKDVMLAYEYLRKNGINPDIVILNEEDEDYYQSLNHRITDIISNRRIYFPQSQIPGIFLLKSRQMSHEEINLLLTVSRIVFSEKRHLMSRRIKKLLMEENTDSYHKFSSSRARIYPDNPLDHVELKYFNGTGGFSLDGKEYIITLKNNINTPAPWSNIIANENLGFLITESGSGYTWFRNSRENKITTWSNDPVSDPPSEIIYLRDENTGEIFTITPSPIRGKEPYRIRHGFGYSVFEHNSHGISQKMSVYVSPRDPVKIYNISLKNQSDELREFSVYFYLELVLGVSREESTPYIITEMDSENDMLTAKNTYNTDFNENITFITCSTGIDSYTGDRTEFTGRNGYYGRPQGLFYSKLQGKTGAALDPCMAIQTNVVLPGKQEKQVIFILGQTNDYETTDLLAQTYRRPAVADMVINRTKSKWRKILRQILITTPDEQMNILLNGWLLYQVISCRLWARSGFYQSSGAYGFRDQLQDVLALLNTRSDMVREHIIRCCGRQFEEGDVQHWWHNDTGKGVRTRISDDLLWLVYVTASYVQCTQDVQLLDEEVGYLKAEELSKDESEKYMLPAVSSQTSSVYEHCIRVIDKSLKFGEHGLPLIGTGDWNDSMNLVGREGRGESVWLGWFLYKVIMDFIPVCNIKKDTGRMEKYLVIAEELLHNIEKNGWDGEWYLRGYFDDGEPLGSRQNSECRIDSIAQSWSVISGGGKPERTIKALDSLDKYLINEEERICPLLSPPFEKTKPDPGYIKGYLPGIRENGGQYTHAAVWNIIAYAKKGDGVKANKLFNMLNPISHTVTYSDMMKYRLEPYVMPSDIYSLYPHAGKGGWSWYTGSAGWMYQAGIKWLIGISKKGNRLSFNPVIPPEWDNFSVLYEFKDTTYHIDIKNPERLSCGHIKVILDGVDMKGNEIQLVDDGLGHNVLVVIRSAAV